VPRAGDVAAGQLAELGFRSANRAAVVSGSVHFEIDGPPGHLSRPADATGAATFIPVEAGTYTVTVGWREENGCGEVVDAAAGPLALEVSPGEAPSVVFATHRRPKTGNSRGSATLVGSLRCPHLPTLRPTRLAIYYERGARAPTHASPRAVLDVPKGCGSGVGVPVVRRSHRGYGLSINRGGAAIEVFAPARMRALMELSYDGRVIGRARATFRPSATGESAERR
jgi:hypothetical protein